MVGMARRTLAETAAEVRNKIERYRERTHSIGEQDTKAALIDPILSALGWSLGDLDEVSREYHRKPQDNPVDYALLLLGTPRLFIEAKQLGKDLDDHKWVSQVLGYATVAGVQWCVLTNGDEYRFYNSHAAVDADQKLFRTVRVSDLDGEAYTLNTLELLSKSNIEQNLLGNHWQTQFADRHIKQILEGLLQGEDDSLIRFIRKRTPELSPSEIRESLKRAEIRINFPTLSRSVQQFKQIGTNGSSSTTEFPDIVNIPDRTGVEGVRVADLIQAGIFIPPLELNREYKGIQLRATIEQDGRVTFGGVPYKSLSIAAAMARKSVIGATPGRRYPNTNGWTFWKYYDRSTGKLEEVDLLRRQYLEMKH